MVENTMKQAAEAVEKSAGRLPEYVNVLQAPLAAWADSLSKANTAQQQITASYAGVEKAAGRLEGAVTGLQAALTGHSEKIAGQEEAVRQELGRLAGVVTELKEANQRLDHSQEAVATQLKYIESNQQLLDKSVQQYESAMVGLTQKLGDGFGSMLDYHIQNAYQTVNEGLLANIGKVISANNEQIHYLQQLFEQTLAQGRGEEEAIRRLKADFDEWKEKKNGDL